MKTELLSSNMLNMKEKIYSYIEKDNKTNIESKKNTKNLTEKKEIYTKKQLQETTQKLNDLLKDESLHAEYSVHKDLGTIMIKVIEDETDKVILEIPPEKILDMVAGICKNAGLFDKKV